MCHQKIGFWVKLLYNKAGEKKNLKSFVYNSSFDGEIISNLFSNLNALNIYQLHKLSSINLSLFKYRY